MTIKALLALLSLLLAVAGCAQQPVSKEAPQPVAEAEKPAAQAGEEARAEPAEAQAAEAAEPPAEALDLPRLELTEQMLYEFLLGEIAGQRGNLAVSTSAYLSLAKATRDPRVAKRATEIAIYSRIPSAALEAATIWVETQPDSLQARQALAGLLVASGRLADARPHLERLLSGNPQNAGKAFLQINNLLGRHADRKQVLQLVQELAAAYPQLPEARLAVAQAAFNAGDNELALAEVRQALVLQPGWEVAAIFQAQTLARRSTTEALDYLKSFLVANPEAKDVRLHYARSLVGERRLAEARNEFRTLVAAFPQNADVKFAVGLLSLQLNELDLAEEYLKQVLAADYKDKDSVRLYLGQIAEERKRWDEAIQWYDSVGPGEQFLPAQLRRAAVLSKQDRLDEALAQLRKIDPQNERQQVQLVLAEAQFLRNAKQYARSFEVLERALAKRPDNPDLLYDYAMAAEKLDRLDVLEANLRKLIAIKPDHAHAYNALGYTLADRTSRLEEARRYIAKALELSPEDPFIIDSMGWLHYRMGNVQESLTHLQKAYRLRPDPEIAAHLGEVLWASGQRTEARRVWKEALAAHPANEVLQATVKKFAP